MAITDLSQIEQRIIQRVINDLLARGLSISVHDGEEYDIMECSSRLLIRCSVGQTDESTFSVRDAETRKSVGWIRFIHGNDCDVISDYSDNALMNEVCDAAVAGEDI